jgi:hypothetical protein
MKSINRKGREGSLRKAIEWVFPLRTFASFAVKDVQ